MSISVSRTPCEYVGLLEWSCPILVVKVDILSVIIIIIIMYMYPLIYTYI